MAKLFVIAHNI